MVSFSKICIAAASAGGVFAAPAGHGPLKQFGQLKHVPAMWTSHGPADGAAMITAQIGLKQNNIKGLQEKLLDISHPDSPNYGKWLSKEEVDAYTAPAETDVAAVKEWLAAAGITEVTQPTNDWLQFTVPVSTMESLLGTKYEWFTHAKTGDKVPRTKAFFVPQNLHSIIDVVTPTTVLYHNIAPELQAQQFSSAATDLTSPAFIRQKYNVDYKGKGSQTVGTTGLLGIGASHPDYAAFNRQFAPGTADFKDVSVNGGSNDGDGSKLEGNLDTQYMGSLSSPNPSQYLSLAPTGSDLTSFDDALVAFGNYLNANSNPPTSVSTSYGSEENGVDPSYLDRICNEFMKAGSRGISVFFSSGDDGVGGGESSCSSSYVPTWPASCPYITSVGGTEFDSTGREVVANFAQYTNNQITSPGGGYSDHFSAPDYNTAVTSAYANSLSGTQQSYFNKGGRGYPDISLVSVKYQIVVNGGNSQVVGTSASSPSIAALVGQLNDYRHSNGKPNLGFINPLLYSGKVDAALRDVTSGNNFGCDKNGFPAKKGWDAASGLGSFDFGKLRSLI